jgi:hypothetical protein
VSGGIKVEGSASFFTTNVVLPTSGIIVGGSAKQTFNDVEEVFGGVKVSGIAQQNAFYADNGSGGIQLSGKAYQTFSDIEETSGGSLAGGTYAGAFKFVSGGEELSSGGAARSNFGYRWIPLNRRNRIYTGGNADVRTNTYRFVASGRINIESDNVYQLSYYDDPCPTTDGFTYVLKYPNKHLECAQEGVYYTQCDVYNRPYKCQNASNAVLSAITGARQQGHLPPRDRTRKFPKVR